MTGSHRRILVVEDDPETAGQLAEQLSTSGYRVDLDAIGKLCREHSCFFFVDAIQSLGVYPMDLQQLPIDGLAEKSELKAKAPSFSGPKISRVVPPLGLKLRVIEMIAGKLVMVPGEGEPELRVLVGRLWRDLWERQNQAQQARKVILHA